jgi:hypothetical protein
MGQSLSPEVGPYSTYVEKQFSPFMELKVSLLCLQEPIGGPYPELHE